MARILVTGSRGTLGCPLVKLLQARGHEVWGLDLVHGEEERYFRADVGTFRQLEPVFTRDFDYVYHLAAEFGRLNGEEYYEQLWRTNVIGTRNILEWQRRKGFRLIFASSSEIYGETDEEWLDEDLPLRKPLFHPNDYAITKWVNEEQIVNFTARYGLPIVRLRIFNAYGPGEYYHPYRSVVCLFCYRALHGLPFQVYEGYYRTFMYIDDLIPTMANVCERFRPGRVYNLGGVEYRSVRDLADLVLRHAGAAPGLVEYLPEDQHNVKSKRPTIERARAELGHDPRVTLEEGVPRTIDWMRQVYRRAPASPVTR
ncbi:MAG: NAD(P)-dependent oxidoreductase [Firmicutes bacterium]|nr:NAD(P)-dependent oxidoreductase [Bacillota bacterium]